MLDLLSIEILIARHAGAGWKVVDSFHGNAEIQTIEAGQTVYDLIEEMVPPGGGVFIEEVTLEHINGVGLEILEWFIHVNRRRLAPHNAMRGRAAVGLAPQRINEFIRGAQKVGLGIQNTTTDGGEDDLDVDVAASWTAWLLERR